MLLSEGKYSHDNPPTVNHLEFYYGFTLVALVFQMVFLVIASDPSRYRPLMIVSVFEKLSFVCVVVPLAYMGKANFSIGVGATADFIFGTLFVVSYFRTHDWQKDSSVAVIKSR